MGRRRKLAIAGALALAIVASAIVGLLYPTRLVGAASWSVVVAAVLFGLGGAARRGLGVELRIGEQLVLGMAVWIAGSGVLLALGVASRVPLLVLAAIGAGAALLELHARAGAASPPRAERAAGERIPNLVFLILLSIFLALNLLGVVNTRGNQVDDQVAYTAFVKRVLDCGDLVEPFSFRRLSAYGGQTMLHALAALRGDVAATDLLDRGIFQWIAVIAMLDLAHRRRLPFAITVVLAVVLLSLWDLPLNSAPIWTGFAGFLAAYGFATRDDLPVRARLALTFAVLGAVCTLRQNYLLPAGLFGLLLLASHLREAARAPGWRAAWAAERRTVLYAIGAAAIVVVPYMAAAHLSSGTALYPLLPGTANPALPLRPPGATLLDEASFFVGVLFSPEPIHVWWLLLPVMLIAKDARPLAPWRAFLIASGVGFAFLIHSFTISDPFNLWRYAFSFLTPLAMVFAIEAGARLSAGWRGPGDPEPEPGPRGAPGGFALPAAAAFLAWLALIVNLVETRQATARRLASSIKDIKTAWAFGTAKPDPRVRSYGELQRAVPEGARLAILLDDPWALDYARNPIVNLDLPGLAAPAPGLPSFTTPAHWRAYLASRGIRYLAFVEPDASAFVYRRNQWLYRMYQEDELFQYMAAHLVDALDTFAALAASSVVLFHGDGMYAIDLGPDAPPEPDRGPPELARMDRFLRRHAEQELGNNAWQLAHRSNVVFRGDGLGPGPVILPALSRTEPVGLCEMVSALGDPPHRWLKDRTRIRVLGTGAESVRIKLWAQLAYLHTKPVVTVSLDGRTLAEAVPDEGGMVTLEAPAPCTGWCDLYILFNSTFDWWAESETAGLAKLFEFDWAAPP